MASSPEARQSDRELAYRVSDGVAVALLWHEPTNALTVCVSDERSGAYFEVAADPEHALDVFEHPYAYAAFTGLHYEEALLPNWAAAAAIAAPALTDRS
jgi:hypothetical protein